MTDGSLDLLEEVHGALLHGPGTESHTALGNCSAKQALVVGRQCLRRQRIKWLFPAADTFPFRLDEQTRHTIQLMSSTIKHSGLSFFALQKPPTVLHFAKLSAGH